MGHLLALFVLVLGALLLFALIMAVGLIFRGKTIKSCGCGSLTYKGETIRCPGCTEGKTPAPSPPA